MRLLDLPSELFAIIIEHYVALAGAEAQVARFVSRAFDNCILRELFNQHSFCECGMHASGAIGYRFETFLEYRSSNEKIGNHKLLEYIRNTVNRLIRQFPPSQEIETARKIYQRNVIKWLIRGGTLRKDYASDSKALIKCSRFRFYDIDDDNAVHFAIATAAAVGNLDAVQHFWAKSKRLLKTEGAFQRRAREDTALSQAAAACITTGKLHILAYLLRATRTERMVGYLYGCITSAIRCRQLKALNILLDHTKRHAPELLSNLPPRAKGGTNAHKWYMLAPIDLSVAEATRDTGHHWLMTAAATGDLNMFQRVTSFVAHRCHTRILTSVYAEACRHGHVALVQHLVSKGLFDCGNRRLQTSARAMHRLYTAAATGGREILAILLKFAKNLQIGDPTLVAVAQRDLNMFKYLCDHGIPICYGAVDLAERRTCELLSKENHSRKETEELRTYHYVFQQATLQSCTWGMASLEIEPLGTWRQERKVMTFPYRGDLEVVHLLKLAKFIGDDNDDTKRA